MHSGHTSGMRSGSILAVHAQNFPPKKETTAFTQIYGKGKLETFRTYTFIDHRYPVDLLLCFELSLSKTLYGFQTPRLTRSSSYLYGN